MSEPIPAPPPPPPPPPAYSGLVAKARREYKRDGKKIDLYFISAILGNMEAILPIKLPHFIGISPGAWNVLYKLLQINPYLY